MKYYDLVLALVPLALVGGAGTLSLGGVPTTLAIIGGGAVATALVGHALFVRSPVDSPAESTPTTRAVAEEPADGGTAGFQSAD